MCALRGNEKDVWSVRAKRGRIERTRIGQNPPVVALLVALLVVLLAVQFAQSSPAAVPVAVGLSPVVTELSPAVALPVVVEAAGVIVVSTAFSCVVVVEAIVVLEPCPPPAGCSAGFSVAPAPPAGVVVDDESFPAGGVGVGVVLVSGCAVVVKKAFVSSGCGWASEFSVFFADGSSGGGGCGVGLVPLSVSVFSLSASSVSASDLVASSSACPAAVASSWPPVSGLL